MTLAVSRGPLTLRLDLVALQVCELDHLVPLELDGADTLDNIWPQCGPAEAELNNRYFKQKDLVENFLTAMMRAN